MEKLKLLAGFEKKNALSIKIIINNIKQIIRDRGKLMQPLVNE